jgi:hypothetical protein
MAINLVPVVALASGWAIQGDTLSVPQAIGCAAILGGVLLGQTGAAETPEAAKASEAAGTTGPIRPRLPKARPVRPAGRVRSERESVPE